MARNKLSESRVKALDKPGIYGDGDGLYLRVQKSGSRNWLFIYRRGSSRNEIGLGGYGQGTAPVSVALAREKAEVIRQKLARGEDPLEVRKVPKVVTFRHCMDDLLATKANDWKNQKHRDQWEMTLEKYATPLHDIPIADIVIGDVKSCLLPHWTERPETADRLRSRIQAVIDYGIAHEWRNAANPARWRGLLEKIMPARQKLSRGHHAALHYGQIPETVTKLRPSAGVAARAVEFIILTASRTGEVRGAAWSEIDWAASVWTVPADRMKAGREHRVPLVGRAIAILKEMEQRSTGDIIFAGSKEGAAVSDTALAKALRLASPDKSCTLHGLRSSFRDWCGDMTTHPREVAEAALAHALGDETEQAYRRSDALQKRRSLMADWEKYCES